MTTLILTNEKGEVYDLQDRNHFAQQITGLGASVTYNFIAVSGNYNKNSQSTEQSKIDFTMLFGNGKTSPEQEYADFIKFMSSDQVFLQTTTYDNKNFIRSVSLGSIQKGEREKTQIIASNVELLGISNWYTVTEIKASDDGIDKKNIKIVNNSELYQDDKNGDFLIKFKPNSDTITWVLSYNKVSYTESLINLTYNENEYVVIDTRPGFQSYYMLDTDSGDTRSLMSNIDITTSNFTRPPLGESSLSLSDSITDFDIKVISYFSTV